MADRIPLPKDETGKLVFPAQKLCDKELIPVGILFLAQFLCLLGQGRTLGRTIEGDILAYKLAAFGVVIGVGLGEWRRRHIVTLVRQFFIAKEAEQQLRQQLNNAKGLLISYSIVVPIFAVSVGGLANRMISIGQVKVERAVVASMPANGGKAAAFWLRLQMETRSHRERLTVSGAEYRNFRVLDIVEVHSRPGLFGYDYVTDIVRVGSQRVGSSP